MIRKAETTEYEEVLGFYYQLIDDMQGMEYHPKWQKGIYPDPKELYAALKRGELFVNENAEDFIAAMRVNHDVTDGYEKISWLIDASKDEVTVIHMLGVSFSYQDQGVGKQMVQFVIDKARKENQKAIRLDVLKGNVPADKLYESMGFEYRDTITLFYEDTGLTEFNLYEFEI